MTRPLREGSPDKRALIARTALEVFLRDGYARAGVDAIAAAAGVSKRTIYDYYGDKSRLFVAVVEESAAEQAAEFAALLDRTLPADAPDAAALEAALLAFGRAFAAAVARSPRRAALVRLLIAEGPHFPALLAAWSGVGAAQRALADRLAGFGARGLLDVPDSAAAAEHLGVLVTGAIGNRSLFGAAPVTDAEIDRVVAGGVRVFLRAYGPA